MAPVNFTLQKTIVQHSTATFGEKKRTHINQHYVQNGEIFCWMFVTCLTLRSDEQLDVTTLIVHGLHIGDAMHDVLLHTSLANLRHKHSSPVMK